jgi:hypothetical protein
VIDPRALQQHFLKVNQRPEFKKAPIPRILEPKPLTAIQAIPVPVPIIEELVTKQNEQLPTVVNNEPVNLIINVPPPIENLVVEEVEIDEPPETEKQEEILEKSQLKAENELPYESPVITDKEESYDPYGYYPGPRF